MVKYRYDELNRVITQIISNSTGTNNPYGFTGQRFDAELRMYSFAYRTYNPVSMRWLTVDPAKDGTNWYQYVSGDPVNLWDPLGLDIIVLNDSDAVDYVGGPYGHNAAIVGDDEDGWVYYSKDGESEEARGTEIGDTGHERTEGGNVRIPYKSLDHFDKETDVSGRYDRRAQIQTTSDQDDDMKDKGDEIYDMEYNFVTNNCSDLVEDISAEVDIKYPDSHIMGTSIPNAQYEQAKKLESNNEDTCTE
ncbi:MAG: RHS repeat-associated core domain-containing protein [Halanaerobiaceae bacterium]